MITKTDFVNGQLDQLKLKNPKMSVLVAWLDWRLRFADVDPMITSIMRINLDKNGIHSCWRAFDVSIKDWAPELPEAVVNDCNATFRYGMKWNGSQGKVAHLRMPGQGQDDTAPHIHFQVKGYGPWT